MTPPPPVHPHPINPARPRPLPSPRPNPLPPRPNQPRPGKPTGVIGLIAALAAIAVLADVCLMSAAWATTRNIYYIPDSNDWVYALVLLLFALWTGISLILAPPRRKRRPPVRSVRAASGIRRSSTSGPATAPGAEGSLGAVAPTSAPIPSPSWRSA